MSDNIINFPRRSRDPEDEHRRREAQRVRDHAKLAEVLRRTRDGRGPLFSPNDKFVAALAVNRLIKNPGLDQHGIPRQRPRQEKIEEHFGTRIDRYSLRPEIDMSDSKRRKWAEKKLQSNVRGYLKAVEAVGLCLNENRDSTWTKDAQVAILQDTSHWTNREGRAARGFDDEQAWNVANKLDTIVQQIMRVDHVEELFQRLTRVPGAWDAVAQKFKHAAKPCLQHSFLAGSSEHWADAPPIPSVPLVRFLHSSFEAKCILDDEASDSPRIDESRFLMNFEGRPVLATIELHREIRLAIGPRSSHDDIGPLLETRAFVRVHTAEFSGMDVAPAFTLKPLDDARGDIGITVLQIRTPRGWQRLRTVAPLFSSDDDDTSESPVIVRVAEHMDDPILWSADVLEADASFEHWYFSWTRLNADYASVWLDRKARPGQVPDEFQQVQPRSVTWFANDTVAHAIEVSIDRGVLQRLLRAELSKIRTEFAAYEQWWRAEAREALANVPELEGEL